MSPKSGNNIETMLEMCSGTSNYPWITIWDIGREYFGRSVTKSEKNRDFWNYRSPPLRVHLKGSSTERSYKKKKVVSFFLI